MQLIDHGLRASLVKNAGGEIAENLDALYEYMGARLLTANLKNDLAILEEVQRLLTDLRDTWNAIGTPSGINLTAGDAPISRMSNYASA